MAATSSPYGLRPIKRVDGMPYAGATEEFLIDPAGYAVNIFNGSVVLLNANGYINIVTTVGSNASPFAAGVVGVFVGCEYTNAQGQRIHSQYYPSGTTGDVRVKVVSDPMVIFQVQAAGSLTQAALGAGAIFNAVQSTSTGSTQNGNSNTALSTTLDTANATCAFRVIGFASGPGDLFTDVLVKFNPVSHAFANSTPV